MRYSPLHEFLLATVAKLISRPKPPPNSVGQPMDVGMGGRWPVSDAVTDWPAATIAVRPYRTKWNSTAQLFRGTSPRDTGIVSTIWSAGRPTTSGSTAHLDGQHDRAPDRRHRPAHRLRLLPVMFARQLARILLRGTRLRIWQ